MGHPYHLLCTSSLFFERFLFHFRFWVWLWCSNSVIWRQFLRDLFSTSEMDLMVWESPGNFLELAFPASGDYSLSLSISKVRCKLFSTCQRILVHVFVNLAVHIQVRLVNLRLITHVGEGPSLFTLGSYWKAVKIYLKSSWACGCRLCAYTFIRGCSVPLDSFALKERIIPLTTSRVISLGSGITKWRV